MRVFLTVVSVSAAKFIKAVREREDIGTDKIISKFQLEH